MSRKDDHLREAMTQSIVPNDFEGVRFVHPSLPTVNVANVDTSVELFHRRFAYPVYINAMTGGTRQAKAINSRLGKLSARFGLMMASGSCSVAMNDPSTAHTFTPIRDENPEGFIAANIGVSAPVAYAQQAVDLLAANALQVHLNAPQEVAMDEGDRDFTFWPDNLAAMVRAVNVPVIAKEVGFGMSRETMRRLQKLGVKHVDVSGRGGTNFIAVENARSASPMEGFAAHGLSTVESLLEAREVDGMTVLASGGVRHAYDVVKALALGAKAVGMSRFFLECARETSLATAVTRVETMLMDVKKIMAVLDCQTVDALPRVAMIFSGELASFMRQRGLM